MISKFQFPGNPLKGLVHKFICIFIFTLAGLTHVSSESNLDFQGYFFGDAAYFNQIQAFKGESIKGEPYTRFMGGLIFTAEPRENFRLVINPEFFSSTQLPLEPGSESPPAPSYVAYMEEGKGMWTYGEDERPNWRFTLGWQYYKDNPHGKIFGDYLLRSMIYPALVFTKFHNSQGKFFGLRLENNIGDMFNHSFITHTETQRYPFYDISLAYTANVTLAGMVDAGAGIHWVSAIPARPSRTTPKGGEYRTVADNTFKIVPFQVGTPILDENGVVTQTISVQKDPVNDSLGIVTIVEYEYDGTGALTGFDTSITNDVELVNGRLEGLFGGTPPSQGGYNIPVLRDLTTAESNNRDLYPELNGTQVNYSFSGQIYTFRLAINPLKGMEETLGKDPFKVYTEAAILGWKNYAGYYQNRRERIPIMLGVSLPTMNFVDFFNVEGEYYPAKKPATWLNRNRANVPQPGSGLDPYDSPFVDEERAKKDDWKWGISTGKTWDGIGVRAQVGSDHMHSGTYNESFHEILSRPSEWYIMLRLMLTTW